MLKNGVEACPRSYIGVLVSNTFFMLLSIITLCTVKCKVLSSLMGALPLCCGGVDMRSCWLALGLEISLSVVYGFPIGGVFVGVVYVYHLGPLSMSTSLFIVVHLSLTYWSFSLSLGCHNMSLLTHLFFTFMLGALFPFLPLSSLGICL